MAGPVPVPVPGPVTVTNESRWAACPGWPWPVQTGWSPGERRSSVLPPLLLAMRSRVGEASSPTVWAAPRRWARRVRLRLGSAEPRQAGTAERTLVESPEPLLPVQPKVLPRGSSAQVRAGQREAAARCAVSAERGKASEQRVRRPRMRGSPVPVPALVHRPEGGRGLPLRQPPLQLAFPAQGSSRAHSLQGIAVASEPTSRRQRHRSRWRRSRCALPCLTAGDRSIAARHPRSCRARARRHPEPREARDCPDEGVRFPALPHRAPWNISSPTEQGRLRGYRVVSVVLCRHHFGAGGCAG